MNFARRVLEFDPDGTRPSSHTDHVDFEAAEDFERDYLFGADPTCDDEEDVDAVVNGNDWLGLRGGGTGRLSWSMGLLVTFHAAALGVAGALMYWYIRDVVTFQSENYSYSLIGLSLMSTIIANSLFALIALFWPAYRFMQWTHWMNIVLTVLLIGFTLLTVFAWNDITYSYSVTEDGVTTTEYVSGFSKFLIECLLGGEGAALLAIALGNLAIPWDDARRAATYKCTLFTSCLFLMLASCTIAVFCALVFRQAPLLLTYIEGWSVYTAGIAGTLLVFITVAGLACSRRALTVLLVMIPLLAVPMGVASGINYYLSYEVPESSSETTENMFLQYSAIAGLAVQPFTILAFGTTCMWRRRVKRKSLIS